MVPALSILIGALSGLLFFILLQIRRKHVGLWLGSYIGHKIKGSPRIRAREALHVLFCMVDHFEPRQLGSTREEERNRILAWTDRYPLLADRHKDSNGRPLQHTWFYPGEAYDPEHLETLASLCRAGYGEIELHHHHYNETSEGLKRHLTQSVENFARHGVLTVEENGRVENRYGFIHGDMALDNSRFEARWCGVNDELTILKETGCYADFSAPTAPCISQTKKINSIYYAKDDPLRPKSHDRGVDVRVGGNTQEGLLIIQGPLALNWNKRKWCIFPTIDNGEIHNNALGTPYRLKRWVKQHIHIKGRPEWVFVKVSCHGAEDRNIEVLLGEKAHSFHSFLELEYRDCDRYRLHYVTARELFNIVKAAESGKIGNPFDFKDFLIAKGKVPL